MFCIYCGAQIEDDAHFCTRCGKVVAENVAPQPKKQVGENYRRVDAAGTVTDKISRVLSALHDSDFDASDIAGEMRCPMSEAQNGFIHLIKRGLLVWMLLLLPVALWSQGIHESWSDNDVSGTCDITFSDVQPSFERSERVDKMTGDRYITYNAYNVPFKKAFDVFLKVHLVHGDWDNLKGHKQKWWASAQLGADNNVTFHKCNGIDNHFDLETEYRVMRSQKKAVVVCSAGKKTIYVYVYASEDEGTTDQSAAVPYTATEEEPEPEEPQAEEPAQPASPNDIIVDSEAGTGAAATAAQSPVRAAQSIFSNIGQSMGQKMKDVLHAAPVAEGTSKGPDSPRR